MASRLVYIVTKDSIAMAMAHRELPAVTKSINSNKEKCLIIYDIIKDTKYVPEITLPPRKTYEPKNTSPTSIEIRCEASGPHGKDISIVILEHNFCSLLGAKGRQKFPL